MIRTLSVATILAAAITLPALAQDKMGDPAGPPPAAMSEQEAPAAMSEQETPDGMIDQEAGMMLTAEEAKSWIDKPVYGSEGKKVGEIAAFARGTDDEVTEMHMDAGGFLGLGETRVKLTPAQFTLQGDRAVLNLTAQQAKDLPKVQQ